MKIRILAESKRVLVTLSLMAAIIIAVVCGVLSKCNNEDEQVGVLSETEVTNVNRLGGQMKRVGEEKGRSHAQLSEVQLRPFDPNHADSATLISLGLSEWQVKCMMAYRRKGGDVGVRLMILVDFMACQTLNLSDYVLMYVLLKLTDVVDMFPIIGTIMELPK